MNIEEWFFIIHKLYGYNISPQNNDLMWAVSSLNDEMKAFYHTDKIVVQGDLNTILDE